MTRQEAHAELRRLAASVFELEPSQAAVRFMERVAAQAEPEILRAALVEVGAAALLLEVER